MTTAHPADGTWKNRWARRRAEKAHALDLHTAARQRAAAQTEAERAANRGTEAMTWPLRLLAVAVALVVLAVAVVIGVVIIGAGIGFYEHNLTVKSISFAALGIDTPLHLPTFTPIATEGVVWATTLLALVMVLLGRTATLWTQSMWFFASVAAFVATWHAVTFEKDLFGGILRGGLSLAGPFLVHLFILWCRHLTAGRTLAQARIDTAVRWASVGGALVTLGRYVAHPIIACRALHYWLGVGHWSYTDAWAASSLSYRRRVQARLDGTHVSILGRFAGRVRGRDQLDDEEAADEIVKETTEAAGHEHAESTPSTAPVVLAATGVRPALTAAEVDELTARLADPSLTADAFSDQRKDATDTEDRSATDRRPNTVADATEKATDATPGRDRQRPVGRANRRTMRRPMAADADVSDLLPAAREVATDLGDRLSRDALLEGLRSRGLSVGGKRRAAIYNAIRAERENQ